MKKTALIIGGSSGVGYAIAQQLAAQQYALIIAARDLRTLQAMKKDIAIRFDNEDIVPLQVDLSHPDSSQNFIEACKNNTEQIDEVYITAGFSSDIDYGTMDVKDIDNLVNINFLSIAKITNELIKNYVGIKSFSVVSSIAAHSPRKKNNVYASAKKALENYFLGIRHGLASDEVAVNIYPLGYVDTNLAYGQKLLFPKISPAKVADRMVRNSNKNKGVIFYPKYWKYILIILNCVPWFLYKKMDF